MPKRAAVDDPIAELINAALPSADNGQSAESAIDAITAARDELSALSSGPAESEQPVESGQVYTAPVQGEPKRNRTKAELQADAERMQREIESLRARNARLEAITSGDAINDLGAIIAFGIQIGGKVMAAQRGKHWLFPADEREPLAEAWAKAIAPYAETIKDYLPLGLAVALTWRSVSVRLEQDGIMLPQSEDIPDDSGA